MDLLNNQILISLIKLFNLRSLIKMQLHLIRDSMTEKMYIL